jgi:hypothetical protein
VKVNIIARSGGAIVGSDFTFVDRLPTGGTAQWESSFFNDLPADVTLEAYATL